MAMIVDDCKTPLGKTKIDPNRLLEILNSLNHSIKFTMESSNKELLLLTILIQRSDDKMWMDIYFKPTDTRRCLQFSFIHPNYYQKDIQLTLQRRICTIVENQQKKLEYLSKLKEILKKYDYPVYIITNGIKKTLKIQQNKLREPRETQTVETLPFISTFDPNNPPVYYAMKNFIEVFKRNNVPEFESIKLINSKPQPANFKKLLT